MALPPTDADPLPAPAPTAPSRGVGPVAVAVAPGAGRAESVVLAALEAIRVGDAEALTRALAERLVRVQPRLGIAQLPREAVVRHLLDPRLRRSAEAALPLAALVRVDELRAERVRERFPDADAALVERDDLVVLAPLEAAGRAFFAPLAPGWSTHAVLLVRLDGVGTIVGL